MEEDTFSETMIELEVISQTTEIIGDWKVQSTEVKPPIPLENSNKMFLGIDPGTTNLGIAKIDFGRVHLWKVNFPRHKNPIERMLLTKTILNHFIHAYKYKNYVTIEGASYGDVYRQVELAEVRAACIWWAMDKGVEPIIAQPTEIRKKVFGNGTVKGKEIWKDKISGDEADALVCAYFSVLVN